jgi:branched-chain amino acid transport system substrate-binding protein
VVVSEVLDDDSDLVSLYARGKRMLREGDYLEASRIFEELAGRFPESPNLDLILFNKAKADYYIGELDKAQAGFASFATRYPLSVYYAAARYFQGNANYSKGNITRAVRNYLEAYRSARDELLEKMAADALVGAVTAAEEFGMGAEDFADLSPAKKCPLLTRLVKALTEKQNYVAAKRLAAVCGQEIVVGDSAAVGHAGTIKIAMVLPLSGDLGQFGEEIYNGAVIAAEAYRSETGKSIELTPYDTKGDPINAARLIKKIAETSTDCVIGPLTSEEASVAAAAAECGNLPLIAPAATQAGLTLVGETSFQLSPNIELQGTQMADYAINSLGAGSAAIITSSMGDDLLRARAFAERFEQLGGTVVAAEYYRSRDTDYGDYIRDLKAMLLGAHPDSVYFVNEAGDTLDPDGLPAHVDCLYLPGQARQLKQLLPQINFYNLDAVYLGSDDWGDESVLKLTQQITRNAVFPSPFLQTDNSDEYLKLAVAYDKRYAKQPQRLASLGFDAVRLIAQASRAGGVTRSLLMERLSEVRDYRGASGRISFGQYRENSSMPLFRIENGQANLLKAADTSAEPVPDGGAER